MSMQTVFYTGFGLEARNLIKRIPKFKSELESLFDSSETYADMLDYDWYSEQPVKASAVDEVEPIGTIIYIPAIVPVKTKEHPVVTYTKPEAITAICNFICDSISHINEDEYEFAEIKPEDLPDVNNDLFRKQLKSAVTREVDFHTWQDLV